MKEDVGNEMLVQRAIDGDRAAFAALISRHYDTMFRVAWKYCGNREDAEDIAQDVCVRLGQTLQSFTGQSKFSTWLYRVVLNATRDHHRKNVSRAKKLDAWAAEPYRPDIQEPEAEQDDETEALWRAVRKLPDRQRDCVLLVFGEELNHADAAAALDCAEGTVASNIHDAKKRLKVLLLEEEKVGN